VNALAIELHQIPAIYSTAGVGTNARTNPPQRCDVSMMAWGRGCTFAEAVWGKDEAVENQVVPLPAYTIEAGRLRADYKQSKCPAVCVDRTTRVSRRVVRIPWKKTDVAGMNTITYDPADPLKKPSVNYRQKNAYACVFYPEILFDGAVSDFKSWYPFRARYSYLITWSKRRPLFYVRPPWAYNTGILGDGTVSTGVVALDSVSGRDTINPLTSRYRLGSTSTTIGMSDPTVVPLVGAPLVVEDSGQILQPWQVPAAGWPTGFLRSTDVLNARTATGASVWDSNPISSIPTL